MWIENVYSELGMQLRGLRLDAWRVKDAAETADALACLLEEKAKRQ